MYWDSIRPSITVTVRPAPVDCYTPPTEGVRRNTVRVSCEALGQCLSVKQEKKHLIFQNVVARDLCTRTHLLNARVYPNMYCNGVYCCTLQQKYTPPPLPRTLKVTLHGPRNITPGHSPEFTWSNKEGWSRRRIFRHKVGLHGWEIDQYVYALNSIRYHDATRQESRPVIKHIGWS
jgi:hypothetical protein